MKKVNHVVKVPFKMFEVDGDNGGHVVKFEGFFLVGFEAAFLEDVGVDVINDFVSSEKDVYVSFHPKSKSVEFKIDGVFMIVEADVADVGPFEKHVVTINFSKVFAKDEDLRVDEAKFEGDVQTDGHEHFLSHFIKMRNQFIRLFSCYLSLWDFWRLVVDFNGFLHVFFLESHKLLTLLNAAHFIYDCLTKRACQLLKGDSVTKAEQNICLRNDYFNYFVLVTLFNVVKLRRVADQDGLRGQMVNFLPVKIQCIYFGKSRNQVVHILRQILRVTYKTENALLLVEKLFEGQEHYGKNFAASRLGAYDEVLKRLLNLEELFLKIQRIGDL